MFMAPHDKVQKPREIGVFDEVLGALGMGCSVLMDGQDAQPVLSCIAWGGLGTCPAGATLPCSHKYDSCEGPTLLGG